MGFPSSTNEAISHHNFKASFEELRHFMSTTYERLSQSEMLLSVYGIQVPFTKIVAKLTDSQSIYGQYGLWGALLVGWELCKETSGTISSNSPCSSLLCAISERVIVMVEVA